MRPERKNDSFAALELYVISPTALPVILTDASVPAGFPSPADDYLESEIDLKTELIRHPEATFVVRVKGDSMSGDGIHNGDILIIDRSLSPGDGAIAVCRLNNEFTLKRLEIRKGRIRLLPSNPQFAPIEVQADDELVVWGIVTWILKSV